jgi:hypothetical protein
MSGESRVVSLLDDGRFAAVVLSQGGVIPMSGVTRRFITKKEVGGQLSRGQSEVQIHTSARPRLGSVTQRPSSPNVPNYLGY